MIIIDHNHRMVKQEDLIENLWIQDQGEVSMNKVNKDIEVNKQSHLRKSKERKSLLVVCAAIVRREVR